MLLEVRKQLYLRYPAQPSKEEKKKALAQIRYQEVMDTFLNYYDNEDNHKMQAE